MRQGDHPAGNNKIIFILPVSLQHLLLHNCQMGYTQVDTQDKNLWTLKKK